MTVMMMVMVVSCRTAGLRRGQVPREAVRPPGRAQRGERLAAGAELLAGGKGPSLRGGEAGCLVQAPRLLPGNRGGPGVHPLGRCQRYPAHPVAPGEAAAAGTSVRGVPAPLHTLSVSVPSRTLARLNAAAAGTPGRRLGTTLLPAEAAVAAAREGRGGRPWAGGIPGRERPRSAMRSLCCRGRHA